MEAWDIEADKSSVEEEDEEEDLGSMQDQQISHGEIKSPAAIRESMT